LKTEAVWKASFFKTRLLMSVFPDIIVITDGALGMPEAHSMQALLTQLRSFTVSCSIIQVLEFLFKI